MIGTKSDLPLVQMTVVILIITLDIFQRTKFIVFSTLKVENLFRTGAKKKLNTTSLPVALMLSGIPNDLI